MDSQAHTIHLLFFPLMAPGHMLPMVEMSKLFAARGVKSTVVTTAGNAALLRPSIDRANDCGGYQNPIQLFLIPFPPADGLPEGCENLSSAGEGSHGPFFDALSGLRQPFDDALRRLAPDCVVTDVFLPWTADAAAELGVPRLVFHGSNFFVNCALHAVEQTKPLESLPEGAESFVIPGLPHRIEMRRTMMSDLRKVPHFIELFKKIKDSETKTYGTVMNSFYELEPDYADYYRSVMGRRAWSIGPLFLCNSDTAEKSRKGTEASSIDDDSCLKWLDSKNPRSVVYICFGSLSEFTALQLREMALGLEASSSSFIWVVRRASEEWIPEGFEERVEGRGLIIKGWAPQILILGHGSIGGFVTHCGWNSSLEGITAGLPIVTCPLSADQFYIERLIVDVLKIGVPVGMTVHAAMAEERQAVKAARVAAVIGELMGGGDEAEARRRRARELGEMAKRAVEEDGSSYNEIGKLIAELMEMKAAI